MSSCNGTPAPDAQDKIAALTPQVAAMFQGKGDVVFVDPRPASAIASATGIIPGAHNIALDDIREGKLTDALADHGIHMITSCQAGPMAALAAQELAKRGFTRVNYVEGGTQGWTDAGFPTDR